MILYIDTTDFNKVTFALCGRNSEFISASKKIDSGSKAGMKYEKIFQIDPHESHETLGCLDKFLKESKIGIENIEKIIVNKGPGSYTGVRVGVTIAQALGFVWGVRVKFSAKNKFNI